MDLGASLARTGLERVEGRDKVTGTALYAAEYPAEGVAHAAILQATVARGEVRAVDATAALALPGVIAVLTHENAPRLERTSDPELHVLQSNAVAYRGQVVGLAVADSLEAAREAAGLVRIEYRTEPATVELREGDSRLYKPPRVNPAYETDTERGDFDAAYGGAEVQVDRTYRTPAVHNNPMEPHATLAIWDADRVTLYDSNQGSTFVRDAVAQAFALAPERVRVIARHVGGGFGQKGNPRPQAVLASLASRVTGRPVKLALTRQQMFSIVGYRTPTIQRVRLGADGAGRLAAIAHDVVEQTSTVREFAEQTAVVTRMMYAAPNRRTTHRLARLDVPTPSWMRAPGECPGMFALESAMDELAIACGLDPVELRARNEPDIDPERAIPFSSRNLVACMRVGADRFGWLPRDPTPAVRRVGRWLVGTGMAASSYPAFRRPSSAVARVDRTGTYTVLINATDIGTGARTALTQIAAEQLGVPVERVVVEIGDSSLPFGWLAGGSSGTASWGTAVALACRAMRARLQEREGAVPEAGLEVEVDTTEAVRSEQPLSRHAFGAQFVEAHVDADTGEVRVPRMVGVFAAGRIINARTARSQLIGGMTWGLSMALHEESLMDPQFGDYVNHDLASYHVSACADVGEIDVSWIDEDDPHLNPMGSKGIGEIGIVGTAAAICNAVHHATGVRVRDLPIRLERVLEHLPS
jgi:xanthine dehydrogenase YagR molybdenum-binding subunit